ncbi:hypothetical protein P1P68_05875 [Streptomyces scabiei]|uniref:hypothetical protein n=1 Tax=Streptomyces scabiei TaxID=1930 RepID=UPI00298F81A5|nr:hypothetical protein [Streptomyces scabiei]MDW8804330.1 hypothetical protein [Streptomyces scabiei]
MTTAAIAAALALGYALGRVRPWLRLDDWADEQVRSHPQRWIGTRWREAALFAALAATQPRRAFGALREIRREKRTP